LPNQSENVENVSDAISDVATEQSSSPNSPLDTEDKDNTPKVSNSDFVKRHFLDINCSYLDPNLINDSYLRENDSELVIFSNNVRSLNFNFHKVEEIFVDCKWPDILAFTETRLNSYSTVPKIDGYIFECVNSPSEKSDIGGVGMYIRDNLIFSIRNDLSLNHKGVEDLWISVKTNTGTVRNPAWENLIIGVIYRHHFKVNQAYIDSMCRTLHMLNESKSEYVIVGDVNINTEKYCLTPHVTNYVNAITSYGCNLFIDRPTRVEGNSRTCLDHVYSNIKADELINHVLMSDVADHYATVTKIKGVASVTKRSEIFRRQSNISVEKWGQFNEELNSILSEKLTKNNSNCGANAMAKCITETYQSLLNKYMPLKKLSRKERRYHPKPWITPAIKVSIKKKNKLYKLAKRKKRPKIFRGL